MRTQCMIAMKILAALTLLLGIVYPLFVTGVAQVGFPEKANGSLIEKDGKAVGSTLVGQAFDNAAYFTPRPSATGYNTLPSGASNLALTSQKLHHQVTERKARFAAENGLSPDQPVPPEMVFASASGLDPHISPDAARLQVNRIAAARGFSDAQKQALTKLVEESIEKPQFGLLGEPVVNVLSLNLRLDELK